MHAAVAGMATGAAASSVVKRNQARFLASADDFDSERSGVRASVHSALWLKTDVRKLRVRKLLSLATEELTGDNLRSLFRLLDENGDHSISSSEIQSGLLLLGFEAAADPVALSRFLLDIDSDRTGTITEAEFLNYFVGARRSVIRTSLDSYVVNRCVVTATFYGEDHAGPALRTEVVDGEDLPAWMAALPASRGRLWLDVVGFDPDAHTLLAQAIGIEQNDLMDALLVQDARLEVVTGTLGCVRTEVILHTRELSMQPIVKRPASLVSRVPSCARRAAIFVLGGDEAHAGVLGNMTLVPRSTLLSEPPAISLEQAVLFILDDRTLVTLRLPAFGHEKTLEHLRFAPKTRPVPLFAPAGIHVAPEHGASAYRTPSLAKVRIEASTDPLLNDPSVLRRCYERLRLDLAAGKPTVAHLFSSSVKGLAVAIIDSILQQNHLLRDALQDWEEVLDSGVRRQPTTHHTQHLDSISELSSLYTDRIKQLCKVLDPDSWGSTGSGSGSGSGGGDASEGRHHDQANSVADAIAAVTSATAAAAAVTAHAPELPAPAVAAAASSQPSAPVAPPARVSSGDPRSESPRPSLGADPEAPSNLPADQGLRRLKSKRAWLVQMASQRSMLSLGPGMDHFRSRPARPVKLSSLSKSPLSLRGFFRDYLFEFKEMSKDLRSVLLTMNRKHESIEALKVLLSRLKADMMNRTLFALTLITALSVPMTFLTALWATNFASMGGLDVSPVFVVDQSDLPNYGRYGYHVFWFVLFSVVACVVLGMFRFGLIASLS